MGHDWDYESFRGSQYAALINATKSLFNLKYLFPATTRFSRGWRPLRLKPNFHHATNQLVLNENN
jgi:hypothetical protein